MHLTISTGTGDGRSKRGYRKLRPVTPSTKIARWYYGQLTAIVRELAAFGRALAADLRSDWPAARDAMPPGAKETIRKGRHRFQVQVPGAGAKISSNVVTRVDADVKLQLASSVQESIGVDIRAALMRDPDISTPMRIAARENVELISSIPTEYFDKLEDLISDAWDRGMAHEKLAAEIEALAGTTESRAALIARDQTSKMNSSFSRVRQTSIGIRRFEWQTAGDGDVRDSHEDLDGHVYEYDDPPVVDGEPSLPGEPINCRCVASPVLDDEEEHDVEESADMADGADEEA